MHGSSLSKVESTVTPGGYYGDCHCHRRLSRRIRGAGGSDFVYTIWQVMARAECAPPHAEQSASATDGSA